MTDLSDLEIVLGKLVAGLLNMLTILAASVGLLTICTLLRRDLVRAGLDLFRVTAASGVAGGALGLLIALWRDRTFQSISLTILMVVFSVAGVEAFGRLPDDRIPRRSAGRGAQPLPGDRSRSSIPRPSRSAGVVRTTSIVYIGCRLTFAAVLVAFGTWKLREWNPGRNEPRELREGEEVEVVESLVEVEEQPRPLAVGSSRGEPAHDRAVGLGPAPGGPRRSPRHGAGRDAGPAAGESRADDRACTSPGGPTARSPGRPGPTDKPGPIRSSGAS